MGEVVVTKENFQKEVLESDKPVLVDFWADWCGPCKMMAPIVAEIAEEHPEYKICKVNVDEQSELSEKFMVLSIPFFGVFKNGELKRTSVGYQGKELLLKMFE